MEKLIEVLKQTVGPALQGRDVREIGNNLNVVLDSDRRIVISLNTAGYAGNYELLLFKLTSKTYGEINRQGVKFRDLIGVGKMVSEDYFNTGYCWRGTTESDIATIRRAVSEYIETWE